MNKFENSTGENYILKNNKIDSYRLYSGRLWKYFEISKLLLDDNYFKKTYQSGYNNYEKKYITDDKSYYSREKIFYIPLSKNFVEFYKLNWDEEGYGKGYIILSNIHLKNNVDSFYEFSIEVEIHNVRIKGIYDFDDHTIEFRLEENESIKEKMIDLFGEPIVHPANEGDKFLRLVKNYFFSPKSRIDKIIGIKKYRDTSTIGDSDGEQFTGEVEEIILDLNNFDENIYRIFKEHGMLEIEGLD